VLLGLVLCGWIFAAATFTINQAGDAGDGVCDSTCTLRDAVTQANDAPGSDTIIFNASLTTITLNGAEIFIGVTLIINGRGANVFFDKRRRGKQSDFLS
jgi:hypothetical protein